MGFAFILQEKVPSLHA